MFEDELGHALGLDHSWDRRSVMYETIPSYWPSEAPEGFFQREDRELAREDREPAHVLHECGG